MGPSVAGEALAGFALPAAVVVDDSVPPTGFVAAFFFLGVAGCSFPPVVVTVAGPFCPCRVKVGEGGGLAADGLIGREKLTEAREGEVGEADCPPGFRGCLAVPEFRIDEGLPVPDPVSEACKEGERTRARF